ncbi:MAG: hypothetical protein ACJAQ7_001164 [Sediminicola sp.]|jgi:hypothetical protein
MILSKIGGHISKFRAITTATIKKLSENGRLFLFSPFLKCSVTKISWCNLCPF